MGVRRLKIASHLITQTLVLGATCHTPVNPPRNPKILGARMVDERTVELLIESESWEGGNPATWDVCETFDLVMRRDHQVNVGTNVAAGVPQVVYTNLGDSKL